MEMKRITLIWVVAMVVVLSGCSASRHLEGVARIKDDHFRQYLLEQELVQPYKGSMRGMGTFVKRSEMVKVTDKGARTTTLTCHRKGIKSVEGLEIFPNLTTLVCSENPIQKLDLGDCPQLQELVALEVPLKQLDVSQNKQLKLLNVSYTHLKQVDVSGNPQLEELLCIFSPGIKRLDLSKNPHLWKLYTRATNIALIDVRENPEIANIYAPECPLQYIVVSPQHDLDKITASVDNDVKLQILEPGEPLPEVDTNALMVMSQMASSINKEHPEPVVLHRRQAEAQGIEEQELRKQYLPVFEYNTVSKTYDKQGLVGSDAQMTQFMLTWQLFLKGIGGALKEAHFDFDKEYQGHCRVYFAEDGYAEYFIYNFLGDEEPSLEMQREMERIIQSYVKENPIGFGAQRPFSQCGGIIFRPSSNDDGDSQSSSDK